MELISWACSPSWTRARTRRLQPSERAYALHRPWIVVVRVQGHHRRRSHPLPSRHCLLRAPRVWLCFRQWALRGHPSLVHERPPRPHLAPALRPSLHATASAAASKTPMHRMLWRVLKDRLPAMHRQPRRTRTRREWQRPWACAASQSSPSRCLGLLPPSRCVPRRLDDVLWGGSGRVSLWFRCKPPRSSCISSTEERHFVIPNSEISARTSRTTRTQLFAFLDATFDSHCFICAHLASWQRCDGSICVDGVVIQVHLML